ncbi:1,4-dihydroxy-2-naphthoate octaprenyltransferase [Salimicrobium halophilum]|uniref:1,4-dihydroxy-2-naphthoate octaprenyltransferase n=1 Tax=Salimicrobium halophilum TaxID=86666 RepID=A0A1G8TWA0_9BACI|nr:1,4-dihydroxy-2-naphthoate octaprenyltransferase [Salimicrobium halophilum]SDJ45762.1 1,4-dihydroxy-2-naphthoate prenyltransferase [Salimicrobium halophilum]
MAGSGVRVKGEAAYRYKSSWFQLSRPMTWCGTISPILAGSVLAAGTGSFRFDLMAILLVSAILIQISANMLNDYFDFKGGQDQDRWEEALDNQDSRPLHHQIPIVAVTLLTIAVLLGGWLAIVVGWWITWIGTAGIVAGVCYSAGKKSLASLGLGEATAFLFLGMVATLLGFSVQTATVSFPAVGVALLYGLLISLMILTNNLRDIDKDEEFRKTMAIRIGRTHARTVLSMLVALPYAGLLLLMVTGAITPFAVLAVLALPFSSQLPRAFGKSGTKETEQLAMKAAARHHWVFGGLLVLGLWTGNFL